MLVRSNRYTVDQQLPHLRRRARRRGPGDGRVHDPQIYYETHDHSLVSRDRHALIIPINVYSTSDIQPVNALVQRANGRQGFEVAIAGNNVRDNDFDHLSQHDLKSGELEFGLPAALIILVLVFGSVVAGFVPLLLAILSIVAGLGLVAAVSRSGSSQPSS